MPAHSYAAPPGPWRDLRPAVVGHRGARGLAPENTVTGMRAAIDVGCRAIELDVLLTADGHVVVWHDPVIDASKCRPTGPGLIGARVDELTLAQLSTLDVGSLPAPGHPRQRPVPGERIPTLAEVFQACADVPDLWWVVEVKLDPTDPREVATRHTLLDGVLGAINAAGLRERTFVHSFDWAVLELSLRLDPQVPRSALAEVGDTWRPGSPWTGRVRWEDHNGDLASAAAELGVAVLSPDAPGCDAGLVAGAHDRGIAVLPWTVNDLAEVDRLAAAGVDGIVTDDPDLVLARLAERPGRARHAH